jgi:hypothetical protein
VLTNTATVTWDFATAGQAKATAALASGGSLLAQKVFTASGTYTPTAGMTRCVIECVGGGSGGNGLAGTAGVLMASGGGGSGGYSRKYATAADIGASKPVTIGAGGAGGPPSQNVGSAGGDTSVGTLCIAKGATPAAAGQWHQGGFGGVPGTGDVVAAGNPGQGGLYMLTSSSSNAFGGAGAGSYFGGGAPATPWTAGLVAAGVAGNYGAGGAGPTILNHGAAIGGSVGSAGIVIITEYA